MEEQSPVPAAPAPGPIPGRRRRQAPAPAGGGGGVARRRRLLLLDRAALAPEVSGLPEGFPAVVAVVLLSQERYCASSPVDSRTCVVSVGVI